VLAVGLALTRPEGSLLGVLALAWLAVRGRSDPGLTGLAGPLALVLLPSLAAYHGARFWYFGDGIPQTFWSKQLGGREHLTGGLMYLYEFLVVYLPATVVVLSAAAVLVGRHRGPLVQLAPLLAGGEFMAIVSVGGDWMPAYRLFAPFMPWAMVLSCACLDWAMAAVPEDRRPIARPVVAVLGVVTLLKLFGIPLEEVISLRQQTALGELQKRAGEALSRPGGQTVVVGDIGRIGYATEMEILDTKGLVNREAVRGFSVRQGATGPTMVADCGWVFARKPDWILVLVEPRGSGPPRGFYPTDASLMEDPRLTSGYALQTTLRQPGFSLSYLLYRRRP
ncbi:MAG: hypothetical protein HY815_02255, partial [Candidatus Riflebacteria bacterium]|nr:hypothetical protein [Candidatus Riflebacteria bacterium]